jgi:hypothetical protein
MTGLSPGAFLDWRVVPRILIEMNQTIMYQCVFSCGVTP